MAKVELTIPDRLSKIDPELLEWCIWNITEFGERFKVYLPFRKKAMLLKRQTKH